MPGYSECAYVTTIAVCFVDRIEQTENQDHASDLQHRPGDVLVDSIERRL